MFETAEKYGNFIAGQWRDASDYKANHSPSNPSDCIGHFAVASQDDLLDALASAKHAQPAWERAGLEQRKAVLDFIGNELIERCEEIGRVLSREEGKTLAEGKGEVYRSGQFFQYYAAQTLRMMGELAQSVRPNIEIEVRREAAGVVGIITPWNFPMAVAAWKAAPALAYGNSVVLKPADITPASAWILAEIISRSGLPEGVFNLVMGSGSTVGAALSKSPDIDAITFTGSVGIGQQIAQHATHNMKKVQLEMGSKNALFVMDDADLDTAVNCAVNGAYFGTGQKCTASSRLIVHEAVHDEFVARMKEAIGNIVVGDPLDSSSQIGSMANKDQYETVLNYMQMAIDEGAHCEIGGQAIENEAGGYFLAPTLFTNTSNSMQVNREEIFGPVACVIKVGSYEQGLETVNDTEFGLTAGIITESLKYSTHFRQHAKAGCVMVNLPTAGTDYHVPFGGRKASSFGTREQGTYAAEFYTTVKTCYTQAYVD